MGRTMTGSHLWTDTVEMRALALELRLLRDICATWALAWTSFPSRLSDIEAFLKTASVSSEIDMQERVARVREGLHPIQNLVTAGKATPSDMTQIPDWLAPLIEAEKQATGHRGPSTLYSKLHSGLENVAGILAHGPSDIIQSTERCLSQIEQAPSDLRDHLRVALTQLHTAVQSNDASSILTERSVLTEIVAGVPAVLFRKSNYSPTWGYWKNWHIICVEDDVVWQETVTRAIELVILQLGSRYNITYEILTDRQSGQTRIQQGVIHQGGLIPTGDTCIEAEATRLLAVLDIGIPANPAMREAPSRNEGLALLNFVRKPGINVPAIVLTTAPNYLGDHLIASELGVSDYLIKGLDSEERLVETLARYITDRSQRKLQILEETGRVVKVDEVEVPLEPQAFRTFAAIVDAGYAVTAEEVVSRLKEEFGGLMNLADAHYDVQEENLRLNWLEANRQAQSPVTAVAWLRSERVQIWKYLSGHLSQARIAPSNDADVAFYLTQRFGKTMEEVKEFDRANISKHVHQVRKAMKEVFNVVGRTIFPEEEVIVTSKVGEEFAYKIVADVVFGAEDDKTRAPFRVLVVENNISDWQTPIARLLDEFGYHIHLSSSVEEAIDQARTFRPDLLTLDMHLPTDHPSFLHDPAAGIEDGGLHVLEAVSQFLPNIRAIAFTDIVNRDALRVRAAELGVRISDFISKQSPPEVSWQSQLILHVHRIEQELQRQSLLPLPDLPYLPYLHLWRSRKEDQYIEAFDQRWPLTENQFKLIWILAERANQRVTIDELMDELFESVDAQSKLKDLINNFRRRRLARDCRDWFGVIDHHKAEALAQTILANDAKGGYILNARVVIEE